MYTADRRTDALSLIQATVEPGKETARSVLSRLARTLKMTLRSGEICFDDVGTTLSVSGDKIRIEFYDAGSGNKPHVDIPVEKVASNIQRFAEKLKEFDEKSQQADREIQKSAERLGSGLSYAAEECLRAVDMPHDIFFDPTNDSDHDGRLTFVAYVRGGE